MAFRIPVCRNGKPRGYAFVEFDHKNDMKNAYKLADGRKIDGRRIVVDVERGRTVPNWRPRRLGGGLGGDSRRARSKGEKPAAVPPLGSAGTGQLGGPPPFRNTAGGSLPGYGGPVPFRSDREAPPPHRAGLPSTRERDRDQDRGEKRDRDRDRDRHRDRGEKRDRDRDRISDRDRDRDKDRHRDRGRDRDGKRQWEEGELEESRDREKRHRE